MPWRRWPRHAPPGPACCPTPPRPWVRRRRCRGWCVTRRHRLRRGAAPPQDRRPGPPSSWRHRARRASEDTCAPDRSAGRRGRYRLPRDAGRPRPRAPRRGAEASRRRVPAPQGRLYTSLCSQSRDDLSGRASGALDRRSQKVRPLRAFRPLGPGRFRHSVPCGRSLSRPSVTPVRTTSGPHCIQRRFREGSSWHPPREARSACPPAHIRSRSTRRPLRSWSSTCSETSCSPVASAKPSATTSACCRGRRAAGRGAGRRAGRAAGDPHPRGSSARTCRTARRRSCSGASHLDDDRRVGPHGRILIRGEYGHDIIDELAPIEGEIVIDKPGKGAFYATELGAMLAVSRHHHLIVTGVTTEVCVHTTVREANDRGFDALVLSDCVGSYFPEFQRDRPGNGRGPGRHLRLGRRLHGVAAALRSRCCA